MPAPGKGLRATAALAGLCVAAAALANDLGALGWKERSLDGNTLYSISEKAGHAAIRAHTRGTASALYHRERIDLGKTPYINWHWLAENVFDRPDEKRKHGDDYPARVYVVVRNGPFPWNSRAINYVWSSTYDVDDHWSNAYTENSHVIVLQSGTRNTGSWQSQRRNVQQDFKTYLGMDVNRIDGYAIMVDGDNTGSEGTAWFRDIHFSAQ